MRFTGATRSIGLGTMVLAAVACHRDSAPSDLPHSDTSDADEHDTDSSLDTHSPPDPSPPDLPGVVFDDAGAVTWVPSDFSVKATYSSCFGICPGYSVELRANLSASYLGWECVEDPGPVETTVADADLRRVISLLGGVHFFDALPEKFERIREITDGIGGGWFTTLTVVSGGETLTVTDQRAFDIPIFERDEIPAWLVAYREAEDAVPQAIHAAQWVGTVDWGDTDLNAPCETR